MNIGSTPKVPTHFDLDQAIEILSRTPATLKSLLGEIDDAWIFADEGDGSWSAFDIVGHLIVGEKTDWIVRMKTIINHETGKTFEPFDRFAQEGENIERNLDALLNEFALLRQESLSILTASVTEVGVLDLKGRHPDLGDITLRQLLSTWVVHDLGHIAQISRVMAKRYTNDVGPWRAYLTVLNDRT